MAESAQGLKVRLSQNGPIPLEVVLECAPGELVALVGPSGAGKTTILRCIAGLDSAAEGHVQCDGKTWFDTRSGINLPPQQRKAGFLFQHYALFPHLSALHNVTAAMSHVSYAERETRARRLIDAVHLSGLESRRPSELSGGQQQRVALARALARDPAVLLLDEPFAAVDRVTRRRLQRELAQLRESVRVPILFVTHDLDEARGLAECMVVLSRGETLQSGPPAEVMARPASPQVARLLDQSNLFDAIVAEHRPGEGRSVIEWLGYRLQVKFAPEFSPGARVSWFIPSENVVLHRRDRPSMGEHENPIEGVIGEFVVLGETTSVVVQVNGRRSVPLSMSIATRHARRNRLGPGESIRVSLLSEGVHLMPFDEAVVQRLQSDPS